MEACTTGAFDFAEYAKHRQSVSWNLKRNLVLRHMSMKITRDGLLTLKGANPEVIDDLMSEFIGTNTNENNAGVIVNESTRIDTKTILAMTDEQRMELYNKIISRYAKDVNEPA